ncbi:MFS transporter [Rhodococcus sp. NPDC059968]|uniref:MFS transporter n=1 Tax=Rhodococcus sp. NPDC059968 TaxID=3347017 RepID=UPI00366E1A04
MDIVDPPSSPPTTRPASASARLERLPRITRSHWVWITILSFIYACDWADIFSLSYAIPAMRQTWNLSTTQIGALTSCAFAGMAIGAVVGGRLSDRFGRRPTLIAGTVVFSIASILSALSPNYEVFAVLRTLTGAGLQAVVGVVLIYVAEMFPRMSRGRYISLVIGLGSLGMPPMALAARIIVPAGPETWRWVFVLGGIGLLAVIFVPFLLPESVRWDESNGKTSRADQLVTALEQQVTAHTGSPLPAPAPAVPTAPQPMTDLFIDPYRRRTVVLCVAMIFFLLGYYGFNNWVPTLLVDRGLTISDALTVSTVLSASPLAATLLALPITDRWERKRTCMVLCLLAAAAVTTFAYTHNYAILVVSGFTTQLFFVTTFQVLYAYLPENFPTTLRGSGAGLANGVGRAAGIASGFITAAVVAMLGFAGAFGAAALFSTVAGLVIGVFGANTHNRNLDDIDGRERVAAENSPTIRAGT